MSELCVILLEWMKVGACLTCCWVVHEGVNATGVATGVAPGVRPVPSIKPSKLNIPESDGMCPKKLDH